MNKQNKDEILGTKESLAENNDGIDTYDLDKNEKLELQALLSLIDQALLAQDILYSQLLNKIAVRNNIQGKVLSINVEQVRKEGADVAVLTATKRDDLSTEEKEFDKEEDK